MRMVGRIIKRDDEGDVRLTHIFSPQTWAEVTFRVSQRQSRQLAESSGALRATNRRQRSLRRSSGAVSPLAKRVDLESWQLQG